jgi:hypothetical protein
VVKIKSVAVPLEETLELGVSVVRELLQTQTVLRKGIRIQIDQLHKIAVLIRDLWNRIEHSSKTPFLTSLALQLLLYFYT